MKKTVVVVFAVMLVVGSLVVGCGGGSAATTLAPTTLAPTTTTEAVSLAGSYTGEYVYTAPVIVGEFPITFEVGADGTIQGTGTIPDGSTFAIAGTLGTGDSFSAGGDVTGAGMRITFDGTFQVEDGTVRVVGTWKGGTDYSGTWTAGKDAK